MKVGDNLIQGSMEIQPCQPIKFIGIQTYLHNIIISNSKYKVILLSLLENNINVTQFLNTVRTN